MPTKSVLPLLLLVLLTWNEDTTVFCQEVNVKHVMTDHVELTWERSGNWLGVSEFTVQFSTPESSVCEEVIPCETVECTFKSTDTCGNVDPCTETTTIISGGDHTAPEVVRVTGPEGVTNFTLNIDQGVLHITWHNPSKESSPCYKDTAVKVLFKDEETITNHGIDEEFQDLELCTVETTGGFVQVWTTGGNGESSAERDTFYYGSSDVVALVKMEPCKPLGCTSLQASWDYLPVCSAVVSFNVTVDNDYSYAVDIDSTNMTITGLQPSVYYILCVTAMSAQGSYIDGSCQTCLSLSAVINNVQAVTSPESKSVLNVTWDPPPCQITDIRYKITYKTFFFTYQELSSNNSIVLEYLFDYYYDVCVKVDEYLADSTCTSAYTTIKAPRSVTTGILSDSVLNGNSPLSVWWSFEESKYPGVNITYQLTWGSDQQYNARTQNKNYIIQKYTNPDYSHRFCVTAIPDGKDDLMSTEGCTYEYGEVGSRVSSGLIIGVSVGMGVLLVALIVGLVVFIQKRRR